MTASKSLPIRPSRESLRKQAKKIARDRSVSLRDAQLALAREYGYAGWQDLTAEVSKRLGRGLEWAAAQARRVIHDNDVERLKELLTEYPALLSWHDADSTGGLLGMATGAYGDSFDPNREENFTRAACAALLIDAGAVVRPSVLRGLIESRTRGLLQLFQRKGLLPRTPEFFAALGDLDAVRIGLDEREHDLTAINEAFMVACAFEHEAVASVLLDRSIALDPELGRRVDGTLGRLAFVQYLIKERSLTFVRATPADPWQAFAMEQVMRSAQDGDTAAFVSALQREAWLLGEEEVGFQVGIVERATLRDHPDIIVALLDLAPAMLRLQPPPLSHAIEFAFTYEKPHLIPLLTRVWPMPDDLPHAAAMGNLPAVTKWFDQAGSPALGEPEFHLAWMGLQARKDLLWSAPSAQQVLDTALAWSVINRHFDVADFLLEHGADINTRWNSHEPASILHELVFHGNYESMQFLIDRGIDMTIKDYRWDSTAKGWAFYGAGDEKMAKWLEDAEQQQRARRSP